MVTTIEAKRAIRATTHGVERGRLLALLPQLTDNDLLDIENDDGDEAITEFVRTRIAGVAAGLLGPGKAAAGGGQAAAAARLGTLRGGPAPGGGAAAAAAQPGAMAASTMWGGSGEGARPGNRAQSEEEAARPGGKRQRYVELNGLEGGRAAEGPPAQRTRAHHSLASQLAAALAAAADMKREEAASLPVGGHPAPGPTGPAGAFLPALGAPAQPPGGWRRGPVGGPQQDLQPGGPAQQWAQEAAGQVTVQDLQVEIRELSAEQRNRLPVFGGQAGVALAAMVDQQARSFRQRPIGPIGVYLIVKDPRWIMAAEVALGSCFGDYIATCAEDAALLTTMMQLAGYGAAVITSSFDAPPHDIPPARCPANGFSSMLDALSVRDAAARMPIFNHLVDKFNVQSLALAPEGGVQGRAVIYQQAAGPHIRVAVDMDGNVYKSSGGIKWIERKHTNRRQPRLVAEVSA